MLFFGALIIEGILAGAVYALVALAFVVVYNASRVINFAIGSWLTLGTLLVATGSHALRLDLVTAMLFACVGMFVFAWLFNTLVLQHLIGRPQISLLMVTLGVGGLVTGGADLAFRGIPRALPLPVSSAPIVLNDVHIPTDKLLAGLIAALSIALVAWFHQRSRTGVALRAIADAAGGHGGGH